MAKVKKVEVKKVGGVKKVTKEKAKTVLKVLVKGKKRPKPVELKKLNVREEKLEKRFAVAVFGSARLVQGDKDYEMVYELAKHIGSKGYDLVTGGGPGMMEAANAGHAAGDRLDRAKSMGLVIKLPWENKANNWVEYSKEFERFSNRLETFLGLMSVAVISKGGLGTVLELVYVWQYTQVGKEAKFPIILVGRQWGKLISWFKKSMLKSGLMDKQDFDNIFVVRDMKGAMKLIDAAYQVYKETGNVKPVLKKGRWSRH